MSTPNASCKPVSKNKTKDKDDKEDDKKPNGTLLVSHAAVG
jgi:hypothetical protein